MVLTLSCPELTVDQADQNQRARYRGCEARKGRGSYHTITIDPQGWLSVVTERVVNVSMPQATREQLMTIRAGSQ